MLESEAVVGSNPVHSLHSLGMWLPPCPGSAGSRLVSCLAVHRQEEGLGDGDPVRGNEPREREGRLKVKSYGQRIDLRI